MSADLISLPTDDLLVRFADEKPTPGSGCAAALMGLLAASLISAVARLTEKRGKDEGVRERAALILRLSEGRLSSELKSAFQRDADHFESVVRLRQERDAETDPRKRATLSRRATAELEPATAIMFEIIETCFEIIDNGIALYTLGYQAVRGDTGAALSASVAAISSAIFVISLNAKTSKARWSATAMERVDGVQQRLARQQREIFNLIRQSKDEALVAIQKSFDAVVGPEDAQPNLKGN